MPVRSLNSSVLKWPSRQTVHQTLTNWARRTARRHREVIRVGYIGSYARGNPGVGSDLDVVILLSVCRQPFIRRSAHWDLTDLPVPADILVYTPEEWSALVKQGPKSAARCNEAVWVYQRRQQFFSVPPKKIMLTADALTFREFMTHEPLPLSNVHNAVLQFLRGRRDVVLFGAHAVNAYVSEPRMTQDIDLLSTDAQGLAQELLAQLRQQFRIAVRLRQVGAGRGLRLFQVRKAGNRHLVDLRAVETLPAAKRIGGVLVLAPPDLIAAKVIAYHQRRGQPKSGSDWRDLAMLLLTFPELKSEHGLVAGRLKAVGASAEVLTVWQQLVAQEIRPSDDDGEF